jgi:hypothetical protein
MKRQAPRKEESYWAVACFSRARGSGLVRQLRRRYLGVLGLHLRPRPTPALGSIDEAVTAADGSIEAVVVVAAADGSTEAVVAVGDGSTAGAMAAEVHGSTAGKRLY